MRRAYRLANNYLLDNLIVNTKARSKYFTYKINFVPCAFVVIVIQFVQITG
jgi:hypothetical protein